MLFSLQTSLILFGFVYDTYDSTTTEHVKCFTDFPQNILELSNQFFCINMVILNVYILYNGYGYGNGYGQ